MMNEYLWFFLVLLELGLIAGLVWLFRKISQLYLQVETGRDPWLEQLVSIRRQLKAANAQLGKVDLESLFSIKPATWKGRLIWFTLKQFMARNAVGS